MHQNAAPTCSDYPAVTCRLSCMECYRVDRAALRIAARRSESPTVALTMPSVLRDGPVATMLDNKNPGIIIIFWKVVSDDLRLRES